jgi:hypothetical protein
MWVNSSTASPEVNNMCEHGVYWLTELSTIRRHLLLGLSLVS